MAIPQSYELLRRLCKLIPTMRNTYMLLSHVFTPILCTHHYILLCNLPMCDRGWTVDY